MTDNNSIKSAEAVANATDKRSGMLLGIKLSIVIICTCLLWMLDVTPVYNAYKDILGMTPIIGIMSLQEFQYFCLFFIIGLVLCWGICRQKLKQFVGVHNTIKNIAILIALSAIVLGMSYTDSKIYNYEMDIKAVVECFIKNLIFIAFVEEWIFRGFVATQLSRLVKDRINAALLSAIIYSILQAPVYVFTDRSMVGGIWLYMLIPLVLGCVLGLIYLYENNLTLCVLLHGFLYLVSDVTSRRMRLVCVAGYLVIIGMGALICYRSRLNKKKQYSNKDKQ